ncbi:UNVERIFIED_CONTAM: Cell cycle serine/threonine-protein kinase cdc5/MSD2 [Siphonaria sp. JEL0065]|nr:Cell cycle serine/threonine-protein kinase cdc5/MSD2 [Siphonaria sp. JEL0065]
MSSPPKVPQTQQAVPNTRHQGPPPPPIILDKKSQRSYKTGKLLGEGGFARCYEVTTDKGEKLAAKIIRKASLTSPKQKQKLFAEIKIHQQMSHPAIVAFQHVFEDDDNVYIILELCENGTMVDFLKARKRLTEPEVRYYMHHLLHGVNYMHQHRVIHRDLKLGNMFLAKDMRLKIGDFGLAALIKHDGERKKTICGTPNYIAPEVLFGAQTGHSFEVDMWSLGVVMYTQLIGKPPFQTKNVKEIYKKIKENQYEFPSSHPISKYAQSLIESLLNDDPELRPTVEEVLSHPFFTLEPVPYSIPVSALSTVPSMSDLNIVISGVGIGAGSATSVAKAARMSSSSLPAAASSLLVSPRTRNVGGLVTAGISLPTATASVDMPTQRMASLTMSASVSPQLPQQQHSLQTTRYAVEEENRQSPRTSVGAGRTSLHQVVALTESKIRNQVSPRAVNKSAAKDATSNYSVENQFPQVVRERENQNPQAITSPLQQARQYSGQEQEHPSPYQQQYGQEEQDSQQPLPVPIRSPQKSSSFSSPKRHPQHQLQQRSQPQTHQQSQRSTLDTMYKNIRNAVAAVESGEYQAPAIKDQEHLVPDVFIIKWIDYSNKYGLGYQLQDGTIGVYFNDSTSILLSVDGHHIEYLYYESGTEGTRLHRAPHTMTTYPETLKKKVTLLKHFGTYMQDNLYMGAEGEQENAEQKRSDLTFLTKYLRTKHGVIFRLSNQVVQINLFDHSKLILSQNANVITYIDKNRNMTTRRLHDFLAMKEREVVDRITYARDILQQMIIKKAKRSGAGGGAAPVAVGGLVG